MLYLLDANVLIDANRDYYPLDRVPQFWDWLIDLGEKNQVKIPVEQYEEITDGTNTDPLVKWIKQENVKSALLFGEQVNPEHVSRVINEICRRLDGRRSRKPRKRSVPGRIRPCRFGKPMCRNDGTVSTGQKTCE